MRFEGIFTTVMSIAVATVTDSGAQYSDEVFYLHKCLQFSFVFKPRMKYTISVINQVNALPIQMISYYRMLSQCGILSSVLINSI